MTTLQAINYTFDMHAEGTTRDPSGVAALLDDWREKLAANPHQTTEADSPPIIREEWVDNNNKEQPLIFTKIFFVVSLDSIIYYIIQVKLNTIQN